MLRCAPSPSSSSAETFSLFAGNSIATDMSVLERQRAVLQQRLYHEHEQSSSQELHAMHLYHQYQNLMDPLNIHHQSFDENSPNFGFASSEITSNNTSLDMDHHQRSFSTVSATNSSKDHHLVASKKKRKAEFDAEEEEECKEKRFEEAGEVQSGVTVKSEKQNSGKNSKENSKASELVQKTDYIHVRARRGQATDNHSLAERARREKISKKMKCLQDLVPGCNKVTGKAGMLDEIINYVQSLQKQVEFLSMKLAALNPRLELNTDHFFAKEFPAYMASFTAATTSMPLEFIQSTYHHQQCNNNNEGPPPHPQGSSSCPINPTHHTHQMLPQKSATSSVSFPEIYLDSISTLQQLSAWDGDWQSLYNINFQ